ncbi:hypothetical protein K3F43_04870 [Pseudomonas tussilaginis]|uniref:MrpH family fimbial adhesin n=1 Tax=unclassified Pseudomonas TaxID=196821 RepID=UPI00117A924B|nr:MULTISPECIES: hypothetical protein [unclassified Pseudomonas]QYX48844.1 hypothetical protein K3F43_04870 [Pseudomonas sp. S11A 273]
MITLKKPYATALRSALASVLLCGAVMQVQAITITTTESRYEPGGVRYYFVVNDWMSGEAGRPNPCQTDDPRLTVCRVGLVASKRPGYYDAVGWYNSYDLPVRRGSSSMDHLLLDLQSKGFRIPLSASILVPLEDVNDELCISFSSSRIGPDLGGFIGLFGPCSRVVKPVLQCEIKGDPTINHKNLPDNALDGVKASTQLSLQCRGPASVTVSASRTNASGVRLRSDDSLYSKVTVNGKDATAGINVAVSDGLSTRLDITSTLSTNGTVAPGPFSGSTVITVSPP